MFASVAIVRALVDATREAGHELGVDDDVLRSSEARFAYQDLSRLIERALQLTQDPALGLAIGSRAPLHMLQLLGPLLLSCRTLRDAWSVHLRYVGLIAEGMSWHLLEGEENVHLVYRAGCATEAGERFAAELTFALAWRLVRRFVPSAEAPRSIAWRHGTPPDGGRYQDVFACSMRYQQPSNELVLPRAWIDLPQAHADLPVHDAVREAAERTLERMRKRDNLTERVRLVLVAMPQLAQVDFALLARQVRLERQELSRRLTREGTTLRRLLNEARCARACRELRRGREIADISELVGFSEPSAFHRAFKRWTGTTPTQFRAHALVAPSAL